MDWEKKFNSILKDTEANLSRVKNKFQSPSKNSVTWMPELYSTPIKRSTSMADIELASTPKYPQRLSLNQSFSGDMYSTNTAGSSYMPFQSIQILQEKLDQQNNSIEHLRGTIHRLETDRENYKEQVRDLRNEIYQLTEKASSRRPDPGLERRIETMRREFLGEIQLLQSQLQITSSKGSRSNMSDTQLMSLNRDVLEIKHAYRDELEAFRRDIEILRSRVSRVELELNSVLSNRRESLQHQDRLDRTLNSRSPPQQTTQVQQQSALSVLNANRHFDRWQINDLRSTLGNLKDKIDVLESSSHHVSNSIPPKMTKLFSDESSPAYATVKRWVREFKHGRQSIEDGPHPGRPTTATSQENIGKSTKKSLENGLLDDLDLSDDDDTESSDFTEFEPTSAAKYFKKNEDDIELNEVAEEDLDIDDLDLSDDDLLSDNSLSDPLDKDYLS